MRNKGRFNIPISRLLAGLLLVVALSACGGAAPVEEEPTEEATVVPFGVEGDSQEVTPTPLAVTLPTEEPTVAAPTAVPVATTEKIEVVSPVPTVVTMPTETDTIAPSTVVADNTVPASPTVAALPPETATVLPPTVPPMTVTAPATDGYPPPPPPSQGGAPYTVVSVTNDDVLNVRSGVGIENPIVGTIPPAGMGVQLLGEGEEAADGALWLPIQYQEVRGWVNSNYLARQVNSVEAVVALKANEVVLALQEGNLEQVASAVHPEKGLRFSPYTFVTVNAALPDDQDRLFSAAEVSTLLADPTIYHWGPFDGTGDPINMTFEEYFARFVYDADFARPHAVGYNDFVGQGSMINNIRDIYPDALVVEYHFEGFEPEYGGLDWRSLRLVLEEQDGEWYLVGIVHSEWTT